MTDTPSWADQFASANTATARQYATSGDDIWADSPYRWLKTMTSPRRRGAAGEALVAAFFTTRGIAVTSPTSSDHDRRCNNIPVEVKLSTLWDNGTYTFQQLRDQDYAYVVCVGISPHQQHLWVVPKEVAWANSIGQHTGSHGADTRWFTVDPDDVPTWLEPYGGAGTAAEDALRVLDRP